MIDQQKRTNGESSEICTVLNTVQTGAETRKGIKIIEKSAYADFFIHSR